jgi:uncharacterized membrane protein YoaK (UPF0700 family)
MSTAFNKLILVLMIPSFFLGAVAAGLLAGGRYGLEMWRTMWREASA